MIALPSPRFQVIGMRTVMVVSSSSQFYPESLRFVLTPLSPPVTEVARPASLGP
ncbi:MAG: hypothetical protein ACXW2D_16025 [Burkholderiaceae bacterium]|jgi:hypothetical protein